MNYRSLLWLPLAGTMGCGVLETHEKISCYTENRDNIPVLVVVINVGTSYSNGDNYVIKYKDIGADGGLDVVIESDFYNGRRESVHLTGSVDSLRLIPEEYTVYGRGGDFAMRHKRRFEEAKKSCNSQEGDQ